METRLGTCRFDEHPAIGEGSIDFKSIFIRPASYNGKLIIESRGFESGVASLEKLLEML